MFEYFILHAPPIKFKQQVAPTNGVYFTALAKTYVYSYRTKYVLADFSISAFKETQ